MERRRVLASRVARHAPCVRPRLLHEPLKLGGEHARRRQAHGEDLALLQLQLLGGLAGDLRPDVAAVGERQLDADLEAEVHDALDERLVAVPSASARIWMSCGRRNESPRRLTGPMNDITNSLRGLS